MPIHRGSIFFRTSTLDLEQILSDGQRAGEFREFNVCLMANAVRGAISEYQTNPVLAGKIDLESYNRTAELVEVFDRAVLNIRDSQAANQHLG